MNRIDQHFAKTGSNTIRSGYPKLNHENRYLTFSARKNILTNFTVMLKGWENYITKKAKRKSNYVKIIDEKFVIKNVKDRLDFTTEYCKFDTKLFESIIWSDK